jgi:translation initiation factor eIF-2B subunit beta
MIKKLSGYRIRSNSLTYNEFLQPEKILRLEESDCVENIDVIVPAYDYLPPKMISLILTSQEGYTPKNIYRAFH